MFFNRNITKQLVCRVSCDRERTKAWRTPNASVLSSCYDIHKLSLGKERPQKKGFRLFLVWFVTFVFFQIKEGSFHGAQSRIIQRSPGSPCYGRTDFLFCFVNGFFVNRDRDWKVCDRLCTDRAPTPCATRKKTSTWINGSITQVPIPRLLSQ